MSNNFDELLNIQKNNEPEPVNSAESSPLLQSNTSKKQSLAQSSGARLGLILAVVSIPVILFLIFFGSALNLKKSLAKDEVNQEPKPRVSVEESDEAIKVAQDENLRGIIAYQTQAEAIKEIENRKPTPEIKVERSEPKAQVKPEKIAVPLKPQPSRSPAPVVRRATPRPTPRPVVRSNPKPVVKAPAPKYDSLADWHHLAGLGSYGGSESDRFQKTAKSGASVKERLARRSTVNAVAPEASLPPVVAVNVSNQTELTEAEAVFLEALESADQPASAPILSNSSGSSIAMAQQVKAKFTSGVNFVDGMPTQRAFIRLEDGLVDRNGTEQIPAGSLIVYEVYAINGGIVEGQATAIIKDGLEHALPKNAFSVLAKNGDFLLAKYKEVSNGSGNSSVLDFALGAVEQTNDLINRPNSSFSSSTGFGSSSSVDFGDKNFPEAIATGGLEKVLEGQSQSLARRRTTSPVSSFWQLKQGSTVLVQVNFGFDL